MVVFEAVIIIIVVALALILLFWGLCLVGPNQVGILTKRMFGKRMPEGQIIARNGEIPRAVRCSRQTIPLFRLESSGNEPCASP